MKKNWGDVRLDLAEKGYRDESSYLAPTWVTLPGCLVHMGCEGPSRITFFTRGHDERRFAICSSCGTVFDMDLMKPID
jgi:hypothetical protein